MATNINDYEILNGFAIPVYRFIENEDVEHFWIDLQNCLYYTYHNEEYDEITRLIGGNNWWIIFPYKPVGTTITEENQDIIKYFVGDSSREEDIDKEWDFDKHHIIE